MLHRTKCKPQHPHCHVSTNRSAISPEHYDAYMQYLRQSACITSPKYWRPSERRVGLPAQDWSSGSSACCVTVTAIRASFTRKCERRVHAVSSAVSMHHITQVLAAVRKASRATRPRLVVGFIRVLCNGDGNSSQFHTEM